ncbi:MAG: CHAD domain-containing protein [Myxococcales bacterium]|nr:CHAD domain-containing protein [Polyangiaceae bacterium]MDW8249596.1 CHAD domain-containing protein [Myxococcales bacterium]
MSAAAFLTPRLQRLALQLRHALDRVQHAHHDDEAIHDFRVSIRRLRSLLKPARRLYGPCNTKPVRAALKAVADASSDLRDEEVLIQTLASLDLPGHIKPDLDAWLTLRKQYEASLRSSFLARLTSDQAHQAADLLDALLQLPVKPSRDLPIDVFARRTLKKAERRIRQWIITDTNSVEELHRLRILYKRLRYATEELSEVLPPPLVARASVAARFQKILGDIHDLDLARTVLDPTDPTLPLPLRLSLRLALERRRAQLVERFLEAQAMQFPP